ncbi:ABC transporter permease subunit [Escherichia coli]|nr:ABC transporter permease subunit [Escherichia coli]
MLEELRIFFPATLELAFGALLLALLIGIPLGILSAVWRNRWLDHLVRIMAITGISTPAFWLGLGVIVLFYGHLQILPGGGRLDDWLDPPTHVTGFYLLDALLEGNGEVFFNALQHLILPALTLAFVHLGIVARQIRSAMLEQLSEDYIRTARASGLPGWYIVLCYALPNALIPSITVLGLALGDLLYGAVLTETVFAWPGMGAWVVTSIQALDFPAVNRGEIVGLVGESGSGKSVTAMLIMRLLPTGSYCVHRGQISLLGDDVLNAREKQLRQWRGARVAMIFQEPMTALNPTLRIGLQMMDVIRHHQPISRREARAKAIALLEEMQIPDAVEVMSRYPFELSGGMRQRVMIALAFSCEPQLIIADEPTTALDVTVQLQVLRLLKHKARASGTAVLFISHDMVVVSQLCDSVYVMYAGSVIESGVTADIIHHPRHPYTIGLLQCAPEHGVPRQPLPAIPGTVPNLTHLPEGCAFRDRCYAAGAQCENVPALTACGDNNQRCACWYPQQEVISV